LPMEEGRPVEK